MSATEPDPIAGATLPAGPAPVAERILALDAVRGFALFGILVVNVLGVSGLRAFAIDESGAIEPLLRQIVETFFQGKFVSLFSILFGISFFLQLDRLYTKNVSVYPRYWRRLSVLFLFGVLHTQLQPGEVLMPYALCGALLLVFYKTPWKIVLAATVLLIAAPHLHTAWTTANAMSQVTAETSVDQSGDGAAGDIDNDPQVAADLDSEAGDRGWEREVLPGRSWDPYDGPEAVRVFSSGSLAEVSAYSREFTLDRWATSWAGYLWITFPLPMMLIGLLIGRSGVLRQLDDRQGLLRVVFWGGLAVGLGLYRLVAPAFAWASADGWNPWAGMVGNILFVVSALFLALAYGAGVFLLFRRDAVRRLLAPLGAVGRMALTNYLLQTLITTGLFWGFGLGWFGRYGAGTVEIIAIIIFASQAAFSIVWLRYFRYGPIEWLWRCGTYWQVLPLKTSPAE
jgi:uncharacterized protein